MGKVPQGDSRDDSKESRVITLVWHEPCQWWEVYYGREFYAEVDFLDLNVLKKQMKKEGYEIRILRFVG